MLKSLNLTFLAKRLFGNGMSAFIQKLNPITGQNDWVVQTDDYDYHQEVARASFADMLHDTERNEKYELGLKAAIEHMHGKGMKAHVLDIGTGTGLLSMMAVRHGADSVVACEAFAPMGKCALEIIALNGYEKDIKVIPKRSTDLLIGIDMPHRANILVTEVFDTELIGEGAISTFKHAHEVLLEKDCVVVPHTAKVYAQVIGGPLIKNWNRLKDIYNDDGILVLKVPESVNNCPGSANLHDIQLSEIPLQLINSIISPTCIYEHDFTTKRRRLHPSRCAIQQFFTERDGEAAGVFMWWTLQMDIDDKVELSCAPFWAHPIGVKNEVPWRDHWMQAVYYFPSEMQVKENEEVNLESCHDEYSLWFNIHKVMDYNDNSYKMQRCTCNLHLSASRTRIGQLNDGRRVKKYLEVIDNWVSSEDVVLVTGHGFYIGLAAAKSAKKVVCVDTSSLSRKLLQDFCDTNSLTNVEIVEKMQDLKDGDVFTVVLSEPYFMSNILPWDNLFYLYLLRDLKDRLAEDVAILPGKAVVKAVAVKFDHLHKIRAPLGTCQGFDMGPFDKLIEASSDLSDDAVEAQPLWEYPGIALSQPQDIATIDIKLYDEGFKLEKSGVFKRVDGCNGIALWVNWVFDDENVISTGPMRRFKIGDYISWDMHSRQGVQLLGSRKVGSEIAYKFKFDCDEGNFSFKIC